MNLNKVLLAGNLTRDPEVRAAGSSSVCNFGIATTERWSDGGERKERTTFVDCEAWGKTAENIGKFFAKGKPIFVEGRLKLDQWEQDGQKRSKLKVTVDRFEFVGSGQAEKPATDTPTTKRPPKAAPARAPLPDDESIPF